MTATPSHAAIGLTRGGAAVAEPSTPAVGLRRFPAAMWLSMLITSGFALAYRAQLSTNGKAIFAIGLILAGVSIYTAVARPQHFPMLVIAFLPYNAHFAVAVGDSTTLNLTNVLVALTFVAMLAAHTESRRYGLFEYLLLLFIVFVFLGFLTTVAAHGQHEFLADVFRFKRWLSPFLLFFLVRRVTKDKGDLVATMIALLYTSTLVGGLTWWEGRETAGGSIDKSRVASVLQQANTMAAFLVYYSLPALALFLRLKNRTARFLSLAGFLVMVRGMLYTLSRGAYLALGSGSAVLLLLRNPLYLVLVAVIGFAAPTYAPWLLPGSVVTRMKTTTEPEPYSEGSTDNLDKSSRQRLMLWAGGIEMIRDHPLRGVGLNRFGDVVGEYTAEPLKEDDPHDAHNAYVRTAAEMGIPALVVMVALLLSLAVASTMMYFRRVDLFDRALALGVLGSLVGVIVSCMFGSRFSDENLMGQFWVLVGALRVLDHLPSAPDR